MDNSYEIILLEKLKADDKSAFTIIFSKYYNDLVVFAGSFVYNFDTAEEIVQDVFVNLWNNRNSLTIKISLKSYLLKTIHNKCIDWRRHLKVRDKYTSEILQNSEVFDFDPEHYMLGSELQQLIDDTLSKLPDDVVKAYYMSRIEGLKYSEIAEKLNVSVRTIEVRIGKALQLLRDYLKDYFIAFVLFINML